MAVTFVNAVGRSGGAGTSLAITPGAGADYQVGAATGPGDSAFSVAFDGDPMALILSRLNDGEGGLFARSTRLHGLAGDYTGASRTGVWSVSAGQVLACFAGVHQTVPTHHTQVALANGAGSVSATILAVNNPVGSRVVWALYSFSSWSGTLTPTVGAVHAQTDDFGSSGNAIGSAAGTGADMTLTVTLPSGTTDLLLFVQVLSEATGGGGTTHDQAVTGSLALAGALSKVVLKTTAGSVGAAGALSKRPTRTVSGSTTPTGALVKRPTRTLAGTVTSAGALRRLAAKLLSGSVTPSGALARAPSKVLTGSTTPTGTLTALRSYLRAFSGSVAASGVLATLRLYARALTGTVTPVGTVTRRVDKSLGGTIAPTGGASRVIWKTLEGGMLVAGGLTKRTDKILAGVLTPSGTVVAARVVVIDVLELTFTPEIGPRYTLTLQATPRYGISQFTFSPVITMPSLTPDQLPLGVDTLIHLRGVKVFDPTSGSRIPATGLSIVAHIALTPTGAAVDASLAITLTERVAGDFHGTLDGAALETHLRTQLGKTVYVVLTIGSDFLGHYPLPVVDGVRIGR